MCCIAPVQMFWTLLDKRVGLMYEMIFEEKNAALAALFLLHTPVDYGIEFLLVVALEVSPSVIRAIDGCGG